MITKTMAKRRLFGSTTSPNNSHPSVSSPTLDLIDFKREIVSRFARIQTEKAARWNFDFLTEKPLPQNDKATFRWEPLHPSPRPNKYVANNGFQRPEILRRRPIIYNSYPGVDKYGLNNNLGITSTTMGCSNMLLSPRFGNEPLPTIFDSPQSPDHLRQSLFDGHHVPCFDIHCKCPTYSGGLYFKNQEIQSKITDYFPICKSPDKINPYAKTLSPFESIATSAASKPINLSKLDKLAFVPLKAAPSNDLLINTNHNRHIKNVKRKNCKLENTFPSGNHYHLGPAKKLKF